MSRGLLHHLKGKKFGTPYVVAEGRYFAEAKKQQLTSVSHQSLTTRGCETAKVERMEGTPWSQELDGKYDLESRQSAFFCTPNHE